MGVLLPNVYAVKDFPTLKGSLPKEDFQKWRHMRDLKMFMKREAEVKVSIMIDHDVPQALIPLEARCDGNNEPG